jgi:hypothetical protein|tara:strand:+ start:694 stop:948 length:255 start_codon:yes stop_codon:yes gene_type:complete
MKYKYYILTLGFALIVASLMINDLTRMKNIEPPILTNTDTIYLQLDSLEKQSDTIKLYYERKTANYHILPSSERIRLFTKRINR